MSSPTSSITVRDQFRDPAFSAAVRILLSLIFLSSLVYMILEGCRR